MKHHAMSIFPLAMLLLLAAATFWLSQVIQGRNPRGPLRHDPDYWAEQIVLRRFDISGTLQHTLVAEKLVHYPDDDTTIVTEPHLTYHKLPLIEVFARMGYIGRAGKEVDLVDEVKVIRHGATDDLPLTVLKPGPSRFSPMRKREAARIR